MYQRKLCMRYLAAITLDCSNNLNGNSRSRTKIKAVLFNTVEHRRKKSS